MVSGWKWLMWSRIALHSKNCRNLFFYITSFVTELFAALKSKMESPNKNCWSLRGASCCPISVSMLDFSSVVVLAAVANVVEVEVAEVVLKVSSIHCPPNFSIYPKLQNSKLSRPGLYKGQRPCKQDTSQSVKEWSYKPHLVSPENTWDVFETIQIEIGVCTYNCF